MHLALSLHLVSVSHLLILVTMIFQEIIRKYTEKSGSGNKYAALASSLGSLTWEKPLYSEFQQLAGYLLDCLSLFEQTYFL